ncbi:hypothetical protein AAHA92_28571 [Salvia divinorum]|uniref:Uncharacterized protein n=1 Tax=Salvia divinorum TaxID=28513 RepID=A0ABD1FY01_SALDI
MIDTTGDDDDDEEEEEKRRSVIHQPSHPYHELKLWRRRCSFKCDAWCTTRATRSSYTCTAYDCQYYIGSMRDVLRCLKASKGKTPHHSLSLSFHVPFEYINFKFKYDVCNTFLLPNYWINHCPRQVRFQQAASHHLKYREKHYPSSDK